MNKNTQEFVGLKKAISWYIDKITTPSKEDNDILLKKIKEIKDDPSKRDEYLKTREQIVLSNGGFAMKYTKVYYNMLRDETKIADLFQEAMLGITEAVDTFNVDKKTSFTTYAFFHVKKRLIDFIKNNKLIKAPREIARNIKNVNDIWCYLFTKNQSEPSSIEISKALKEIKGIELPTNVIDDIRQLLTLSSADSDDSFITEYNEQVVSEDEDKLFLRMAANIKQEIQTLPEQEQKTIILRFGIDKEYPHCMEEIEYMLNIGRNENDNEKKPGINEILEGNNSLHGADKTEQIDNNINN